MHESNPPATAQKQEKDALDSNPQTAEPKNIASPQPSENTASPQPSENTASPQPSENTASPQPSENTVAAEEKKAPERLEAASESEANAPSKTTEAVEEKKAVEAITDAKASEKIQPQKTTTASSEKNAENPPVEEFVYEDTFMYAEHLLRSLRQSKRQERETPTASPKETEEQNEEAQTPPKEKAPSFSSPPSEDFPLPPSEDFSPPSENLPSPLSEGFSSASSEELMVSMYATLPEDEHQEALPPFSSKLSPPSAGAWQPQPKEERPHIERTEKSAEEKSNEKNSPPRLSENSVELAPPSFLPQAGKLNQPKAALSKESVQIAPPSFLPQAGTHTEIQAYVATPSQHQNVYEDPLEGKAFEYGDDAWFDDAPETILLETLPSHDPAEATKTEGDLDTVKAAPHSSHAPHQAVEEAEQAPPTAPQPAKKRFLVLAERYVLLEKIGEGATGEVYRVHDLEVGDVIALKLLSSSHSRKKDSLERFRREVRLARRVTHRHIARIFDMGKVGERYYLTMELIQGHSLDTLIAKEPLSFLHICSLLQPICEGLQAAHEVGVIHRDLKPENILLEHNGRIVITDFGIARQTTEKDEGAFKTNDGSILGTPAYMAPEQIRAAGVAVDHRVDIYALGAILYEMITATPIAKGDSLMEILIARVQSPPPDPRALRPDTPDNLAEFTCECMALHPDGRPPNMGAMLERIAQIKESLEQDDAPRPTARLRGLAGSMLSLLGSKKS
jgi:tRNA A-37 threonylcarbamoyl transferase component Bud32